jgi:hypothetical protein
MLFNDILSAQGISVWRRMVTLTNELGTERTVSGLSNYHCIGLEDYGKLLLTSGRIFDLFPGTFQHNTAGC